VIHIAEATDEAIRQALLRCWCRQLAGRLPPHEYATDAVAALAAELGRVLRLQNLLRRTRRDTGHLERRAEGLVLRLASLGLSQPA
jgi:hypothetical protein